MYDRERIPMSILVRRILDTVHDAIHLLSPIQMLQKRIHHIHTRRDTGAGPYFPIFNPARAWNPGYVLPVLGICDPGPGRLIGSCSPAREKTCARE